VTDEPTRPATPAQPPASGLTRREVGSWLEGPGAAGDEAGAGYRGERLGLPQAGLGAVSGFGRRLGALFIDWFGSLFVAGWIVGTSVWADSAAAAADRSLVTLGVFGLEVAMLTWLAGASFGQRLLGLRVVRLDGSPLGLWRAVLRTALLCLAIPALIWDRDGRGLHDKAVGSVAVRAR
jgi:uncharacterized RDD family membrane protein YckC